MATKGRNLYLYLTLACFVGLIAIFIVDGYLGVYDTLYLPVGEREEKIEADDWLLWAEWERAEVAWGEKAFFRYEVDNRQFSTYSANIEVSVWHSREMVRDLLSKQIVVDAFEKGELEWVVDTAELLPSGISPEQGYEYTVIIERGEIERKIIVYMYPLVYPVKPAPVPRE
jgi:hypothetical protein